MCCMKISNPVCLSLFTVIMGCGSLGGGGGYVATDYSMRPLSAAYFDKMPSEGWATDPYYSYQMYTYYPFNFKYGGFGPHGPESIKRIAI